jgi:hypothetical protein
LDASRSRKIHGSHFLKPVPRELTKTLQNRDKLSPQSAKVAAVPIATTRMHADPPTNSNHAQGGEMKSPRLSCQLFCCVIAIALLASVPFSPAQDSPIPAKGPGNIVVRPKFGGQMSGYDIDQNGTEGVLAEQLTLKNGDLLSAVETFDQATGKILAVVRKGITQFDDDIVIGIVGDSTAIVLHEHAHTGGAIRTYHVIRPLSANKYTGEWLPPDFDTKELVFGVSHDQQSDTAAFLVLHNIYPGTTNFAFTENMQTQTFGKEFALTANGFTPFSFPAFGYDVNTNTAVLASNTGCNYCTADIGLLNLGNGKFNKFAGLGKGLQRLAVDSEDGIACTTSADDASVEFYNLKDKTGLIEDLPGGVGQPNSGFDVEYDPIHKLFLIFQSDGPNEHSFIQVYDPKGNLVDSIDFGPFNRYGGYIALHPSERSGFLGEGPVLRSFTY